MSRRPDQYGEQKRYGRDSEDGKASIMTYSDYLDHQRQNLQSALRFELFGATIPQMNDLYEFAIATIPSGVPPIFGQLLLVCHKSFLAAATLIGQAQPDDAGPITRRAIEVVRLAAAIKDDPKIAEQWADYERRTERWEVRRKGKKPERLHVPIPVKHPLVEELMQSWGMLSDAHVHFTPEHFVSLKWQQSEDSMFLNYFSGDQGSIERAIIHLIGAHMMMLRIFDDCLDGCLHQKPDWDRIQHEIRKTAGPYAAKLTDGAAADDLQE